MSDGDGRDSPPAPLRIAINGFCTPVGGGRTHLWRILPRMSALGPQHQFTVFGTREDEDLRRSLPHPNVTWRDVGFSARNTKSKLMWENLVFPFALLRGQFDVVLCPSNLSHFGGWTPRVIVVHNSLPFYPELHRYEDRRTQRRLRLLAWGTHRFIRKAEGTVFVSRRAREDALRGTDISPRDEAVVYHGVDAEFGAEPHEQARVAAGARYGIPDGYVLYASHLYRYKRFEALLDAWDRLPDPVVRGRHLVIAGEPHDRLYAEQLARRVKGHRAPDRVRFVGGVTTTELSRLHAGADAIAFLSVCESGSISVLEALASGRPILLSNRSVMPELGGDGALYADPDRPDDVAEQLRRLLTDAPLARELGERARRRAAVFTWERTARGVLELLERVGTSHATGRTGR